MGLIGRVATMQAPRCGAAWLLVPFQLLAGVFLAGNTGRAEEPAYRIVVNVANPASSLTRAQISNMFLRRITRWPDGRPALPVDQSTLSAVRSAFTSEIHGRSVAAVANYWQQQIFSGGEPPPPVKTSDDEVLAYVRERPGAIGYVSVAASLGGAVKPLEVRD